MQPLAGVPAELIKFGRLSHLRSVAVKLCRRKVVLPRSCIAVKLYCSKVARRLPTLPPPPRPVPEDEPLLLHNRAVAGQLRRGWINLY